MSRRSQRLAVVVLSISALAFGAAAKEDYSDPHAFLSKYVLDGTAKRFHNPEMMKMLRFKGIEMEGVRLSTKYGATVVCATLRFVPESPDITYMLNVDSSGSEWFFFPRFVVLSKEQQKDHLSADVVVPRIKMDNGVFAPADMEGDHKYISGWGSIGHIRVADPREITEQLRKIVYSKLNANLMLEKRRFVSELCYAVSCYADNGQLDFVTDPEALRQLGVWIHETRKLIADMEVPPNCFPNTTFANFDAILQILKLKGVSPPGLPGKSGEWHLDKSAYIEAGLTVTSLEQLFRVDRRHVRRLYLRGGGFDAKNAMLKDLFSLTELDISETGIADIPDFVFALPSLRRLWLVRNPIATLPPAVSKLKNLNYMNLDGTGVKALPDELAQLSELRYLRLNGTAIASIPESLRRLSKMRRFYARDTKLEEVPPVVESWKDLEDIALDKTGIGSVPDWLMKMPKLKRVSFSRCGRLSRLPEDIEGWRRLQILDVSHTPISGNVGEMRRIRERLGESVVILF